MKPEYARKIIDGTKTVELRKSAPNLQSGDLLIIYTTSPVKEVCGVCTVLKVLKDSPESIWKVAKSRAGISRKAFEAYYHECPQACCIVISKPKALASPIKLSRIRKTLPGFHPPRSYRYIDSNLMEEMELANLLQ